MDPCRVGSDHINGWWVSTVFIGLDHSFGRQGPPIVFETMVFPEDNYDEHYMNRYATWAEAEAGHRRVVEELKAGKMPEELYSDPLFDHASSELCPHGDAWDDCPDCRH